MSRRQIFFSPGFRLDIEANEQAFPTTVTRFALEPTSKEPGEATYMRMHFVPQANADGGTDVRMAVIEKIQAGNTGKVSNLRHSFCDVTVPMESS